MNLMSFAKYRFHIRRSR